MVLNMLLRCRCVGGHSIASLTIEQVKTQNASWLQKASLSKSAGLKQILAETPVNDSDESSAKSARPDRTFLE
jgi:hypothetical protein